MSNVLGVLKQVKERLPDNYSSHQLLSTLDMLLLHACYPIIERTRFFDRHLGIISGWYSSAARRKIASLPSKDRFTALASAFIVSNDTETRVEIWKKIKLERTIVFWLLNHWLEQMSGWTEAIAENNSEKQRSCERKACFVIHSSVFQIVQHVEFWRNKASEFKQMLMEKYMRYVMVEANNFYQYHRTNNPHMQFDLDEVAQDFCLAVSKAIDKCDSEKGTLTSYIQNWLHDARTNRSEYGTAFSLPSNQRRAIAKGTSEINNISISLDAEEVQEIASDSDVEEHLFRSTIVTKVQKLAKSVDPLGIGRISLKITEILSPEEVTLLKTAC